jgi:hypothetical protein
LDVFQNLVSTPCNVTERTPPEGYRCWIDGLSRCRFHLVGGGVREGLSRGVVPVGPEPGIDRENPLDVARGVPDVVSCSRLVLRCPDSRWKIPAIRFVPANPGGDTANEVFGFDLESQVRSGRTVEVLESLSDGFGVDLGPPDLVGTCVQQFVQGSTEPEPYRDVVDRERSRNVTDRPNAASRRTGEDAEVGRLRDGVPTECVDEFQSGPL